MNEDDRWIYFDGPEPERLRPLFDALRDAPPVSPADRARAAKRLFARLDAELGGVVLSDGASEREVMSGGAAALPARTQMRVEAAEEQAPLVNEGVGVIEAAAPASTPAPLAMTAPALDLPAEVLAGALPFQGPAQRAPGPAVKAASKTVQVPVMRTGLPATVSVSDAISKAVAAVPFPGAAGAPAVISFPQLTVENVASLRAELHVTPERRAAILARYAVANEAALRALDEHWEERLTARPEERVALAEAFRLFVGYLRERGGR